MADLVRKTIENMVPDIVSLVKRKIFTRKEAKEILKAREQAEYIFLRKTCQKKDYLKAIQYEFELEQKRRENFKALNLRKQKEADYSIIRRIIFLFDRLTNKYPQNIELWKEYCLFCFKIKSNKMFFKAVSQALTMNWSSLAVYYHFEMTHNPFKARKTFLKGLKINNNNRSFWLEYFRFETKCLHKIQERSAILEEENQNNSKIQTEDKDFMSLSQKPDDQSLPKGGTEVLKVIFEMMVENFPNDDMIAADGLKILQESEINQEVIDEYAPEFLEISKKFNSSVNSTLNFLLALHNIDINPFKSGKTDAELKKSFKSLVSETNKIHDSYFSIVKKLVEIQNYLKNINMNRDDLVLDLINNLLNKVPELDEDKIVAISEELIKFIERTKKSSKEVENFLKKAYKSHANRGEFLRIVANFIQAFPNNSIFNKEEISKKIQDYIQANRTHLSAEDLYTFVKASFDLKCSLDNPDQLSANLKDAIKYIQYNPNFKNFVYNFLQNLIQSKGVDHPAVNDCFKIVFNLKHSCPAECSLLYISELSKVKPSSEMIKKHLTDAVGWHGDEPKLWLELIKWEVSHGNPMNCPNLCEKAQTLCNKEDFFARYIELIQNV